MMKPKLGDYFEVVRASDGEARWRIDFVGYVFALEDYVKKLEEILAKVRP